MPSALLSYGGCRRKAGRDKKMGIRGHGAALIAKFLSWRFRGCVLCLPIHLKVPELRTSPHHFLSIVHYQQSLSKHARIHANWHVKLDKKTQTRNSKQRQDQRFSVERRA